MDAEMPLLRDTNVRRLLLMKAHDGFPESLRRHAGLRLWNHGWSALPRTPRFRGRFLSGIPPVPPPPADQKYDLPVLVHKSVSLMKACECAGIRYLSGDGAFMDQSRVRRGEVYWIWCESGREHMGISPDEASRRLHASEVGLTAFEGVSLHLLYPNIAATRFLDLIGSFFIDPSSREVKTACLGLWPEGADGPSRLELHWVSVTESNESCGAPVAAI